MKLKIDTPIKDLHGKQLENKGKKITVGEMLLDILQTNILIKENKEAFWITEIGMIIANGKKEIELSDDKYEFLKRIVTENKIKGQSGIQDIYFLPFVWGQMMAAFNIK